MTRRPILPCVARLVGLALLVSGCGLADYEGKMAEAQKRLKQHEEEERLLGPAIVIPSRDDGKGNKEPVANLHLRLPKGLSPNASNENNPHERGKAKLYNYGPTQAGGTGPVKLAVLAFAGEQKDFLADVRGWFGHPKGPATKPFQVRPAGREAMTFEVQEVEDGDDILAIHAIKAGKEQAAVVYRVTKAQYKEAAPAIKASLESFGLGDQAARARAAAARSPLKVPKK